MRAKLNVVGTLRLRRGLMVDPIRVPGLPIRDYARSCNNREHARTQMSAINVTEKIFFERLYLVPGLHKFAL